LSSEPVNHVKSGRDRGFPAWYRQTITGHFLGHTAVSPAPQQERCQVHRIDSPHAAWSNPLLPVDLKTHQHEPRYSQAHIRVPLPRRPCDRRLVATARADTQSLEPVATLPHLTDALVVFLAPVAAQGHDARMLAHCPKGSGLFVQE